MADQPSFSPTLPSDWMWDYQVVALPRDIMVMRKMFSGPDPAQTVASYVEQVIKERVREGWEFYRIDTVNILEHPGCLASLLGVKATLTAYNLLTFRKPKAAPGA